DQFLQQQHPLQSLTLAKDLFRQVVDGLHFLHRLGIVHRDLKPANILVREESSTRLKSESTITPGTYQLKLIDFGFAKSVGCGTDSGQVLCTSHKGKSGSVQEREILILDCDCRHP